MSEIALELPTVAGITPLRPIRVTLREIREVSWRALLSSGLSAGEAATAANLVTAMELHEGTGLRALDEQLRSGVPGRVSINVTRDAVIRLDDPAERNCILLAPLAIDLALATGKPVMTASNKLDAAYEWYCVDAFTTNQPAVALLEVSAHAAIGSASTIGGATLQRSIDMATLIETDPSLAHSISESSALGGGVLVHPLPQAPGATGVEVSTLDARTQRRRAALSLGIFIDAHVWRQALDASHNFLVKEDNHA